MSQTADTTHTARRGMSLLELIVAMAIFTIIMSSIMLIFSTITNTVRRSYRTMDLFEATQGALRTIERDVQTAFSAPAIGANFHFYGEPNGFIFVGIAPDGRLGRLTYAVHVDTSRLTSPHESTWRGEQISLLRSRADMLGRFPDFNTYYPETEETKEYVDVQVELVYGLLTRFYEQDVNNVSRFPLLDIFALHEGKPHLPMPLFFTGTESIYRNEGLPWFFRDIKVLTGGINIPSSTWETLETVELCHYWVQMMNGPRIVPPAGWAQPLSIWRPDDVLDQFWYDHVPFRNTGMVADGLEQYPNPFLFNDTSDPNLMNKEWRSFLWDHVVARDFLLHAWLLDQNGERISTFNIVDITPVFRYNVESGLTAGNNIRVFNTLFNLDTTGNDFTNMAADLDAGDDIAVSAAMGTLTKYRQFYELGNPLQSRLPSAFEITLTVISPPVTPGAPVDMYTFAQTIHIPSGFLRRNLAVD